MKFTVGLTCNLYVAVPESWEYDQGRKRQRYTSIDESSLLSLLSALAILVLEVILTFSWRARPVPRFSCPLLSFPSPISERTIPNDE
jgi:hypothetical protein